MILSQAIALFALAQQPTGGALIPDWEVTLPGRWGGESVQTIADIDGDAIADWFIYSLRNPAMVLSSRNGAVLWQHTSLNFGGFQIADLDADGVEEVLLMDQRGANETGAVECLDARTGVLKWATRPIKSLNYEPNQSWIVDLDQDGVSEIIVSDLNSIRSIGSSLICVAADGHVNWVHGLRGSDSLLVEDIDADGSVDILIGDPTYQSRAQLQGEGRVVRVDPISGQDMWQVAGGARLAHLGAQLRAVDLDSNGVSEVLAIQPSGAFQGAFFTGSIACIGADGSFHWAAGGGEGGQEFGKRLSIGDGDKDGWKDLYVGLPTTSQDDGLVVALDGQTGLELWRAADWPDSQKSFGHEVWFVKGATTGHDWLVVEVGPDLPGDNMRELTGFDFRRPDTGARVAQIPIDLVVRYGGETMVADFNSDGEPEVISTHTLESWNEILGVTTPSLGFAWSVEEETIGHTLFVDSGSVQRPARVITSQRSSKTGTDDAGAILCFDLLTGRELWSAHGALEGGQLGAELLQATDTVGEPLRLLQANPFFANNGNGVRLYDLESGDLKATYLSRDMDRRGLQIAIAPDADADGLHRTLAYSENWFMQIGEQHRKAEFVTATSSQVSASMGGQVLLDLDFNIEAAF